MALKSYWKQKLRLIWKSEIKISQLVEEILRFDPPLHIFTRYAYDQIDLGDYTLKKVTKLRWFWVQLEGIKHYGAILNA